jgi:RNA polymerase sigma-70 factor, ECF subfamily
MNGAEQELERHRRELTGYCARMLGSPFEAEDAAQEALARAWRGLGGLDRRAALRAWLYRIATNVCRDMVKARQPTHGIETAIDVPAPVEDDPAEVATRREAVRLAVAAAHRRLTPRQRAALILCEVLGWRASEAAGLLDTGVASVTSALQRARATLAGARAPPPCRRRSAGPMASAWPATSRRSSATTARRSRR